MYCNYLVATIEPWFANQMEIFHRSTCIVFDDLPGPILPNKILMELLVTWQYFQTSVSREGTRIIYERKFLLDLRNSPLSRTPPANLPSIPGVTCEDNGDTTIHEEENQKVPESPPVNKPPEKHGQGERKTSFI